MVYETSTGGISTELPPPGSGLRWDELVDALAVAYEARFGPVE